MRKIVLFGAAVVATLALGIVGSEARQVLVWNQYYTVDDGPAVAVVSAPAPADKTGFKAEVEHPERISHHRAHKIDMDLR